MVWLLGTLGAMGKGAINATVKSAEFAVDIAQGVVTEDEYDGVWGTIWGSWEDNVLGAKDGDGVVQHLFGEEGVGGRFFGAIPEAIRDPVNSVITPTFEAMDIAYKYGIDKNLGTLIQIGQEFVHDSFDVLTGDADLGEIFNVFDPSEWQQAYKITETRSAGQSLIIAARGIDLDNAAEVERFKGTGMYKMASGIFDAFGNIILDPSNFVFGAGLVGKSKNVQRVRNLPKKALGLTYKTTEEALQRSKGYQRFESAIEKLRFADDLEWSDSYKRGQAFTNDDIKNIDLLTARIMKEAQKGNLGVNQKAFTVDQARAMASLPNKAARDAYFKLAVTGGGPEIIDEMVEAARKNSLEFQKGGLQHELAEVKRKLEDAGTNPEWIDADARRFLLSEQKRIEQKLMNDNPELPFGAALSMVEERLRAIAMSADLDRGAVTAEKLNARYDALNEHAHLVDAATDSVLLQNHIDTMTKIPEMGYFNEFGVGVKTFIEQAPILGGIVSHRSVRAIVEKVPQNMMIWDDVDQSFTQFQRMLRDAARIGMDGVDEAFVEKRLGQWTSTSDQNILRDLFNNSVDEINNSLVNHFAKRMEGVDVADLKNILQKQYRAGDEALKGKAKTARVYGNKQLRITDAVEGGETTARFLPITVGQLEKASLVPRYDLYRKAFTDKSMFAQTADNVMSVTSGALNAFTSVWKKSVLLRPAWPMRVLIDEYARSAAHIGTVDTLKSMMGGMNDLRASWFRKEGIDIGPLIQQKMVDDLAGNLKPVDGVIPDKNYYDIVEQYVAKNGADSAGKLVKKVLYDEYGKKRIRNRSFGVALGAGIIAGPVGLAVGGLYALNARASLQRLAKLEAANAIGMQLRSVARTQLRDKLSEVRKSVENVTDPVLLKQADQDIKDLQVATNLVESQAKNLTDSQIGSIEKLKQDNAELYANFDKAGFMLKEAGVGNPHIGGIGYSNHFGNSPQEIAIHRAAISADSSNRTLWDSSSMARRKKEQVYKVEQFDYTEANFSEAWTDTVNRQWIPSENASVNNGYQALTRMVWEGKTDSEIIAFLNTKQGSVLLDAMPEPYFKRMKYDPKAVEISPGKFEGGVRPDPSYSQNAEIAQMRAEFDSLIPDIPEFASIRKQAALGREVNWNRDMQPIINKFFEGDINVARQTIRNSDFGKVIGASTIRDMSEASGLLSRIQKQLDTTFNNIGTMPTDILNRSVVFKAAYTREMAQRVARYEDKGTFVLKEADIKAMEVRARKTALAETKSLLYDLAERSKFEEVVSNLMPFYGAWQEVITRWVGLAHKNPAFVATGSRNFRKGMETFDGEDEDGNPLFMLRLPEQVMKYKIPLLGDAFGKLSSLGDNAVKFNFGSASMLSAGIPGFGPLVAIPASETVLQTPELADAFSFLLPFGPTEGNSFAARLFEQTVPTWVKTAASTQFDTPQKQRIKARVAQDLMVVYYNNGEIVESEADFIAFENEVDRRASDILTVRMLGNLAIPLQVMYQSPHYKIITEYSKHSKELGLEAADDWLIETHPEMYAVTGRQTKVKSVASATLEGEKLYQETKEFTDEHEEIAMHIIGKIGALDSGFVYNAAVQTKELNEGRRVRLTPSEIYTRAGDAKGWHLFRDAMTPVNDELARRGANGLSINLNANTNADLQKVKRGIIEKISATVPSWADAYNKPSNDFEKAELIQDWRDYLDSPLFMDRVERPHIEKYIETRDMISVELERRSGSDPKLALLSNDKNSDLKSLWEHTRLTMARENDFATMFHYYFKNDDSISRTSWPKESNNL